MNKRSKFHLSCPWSACLTWVCYFVQVPFLAPPLTQLLRPVRHTLAVYGVNGVYGVSAVLLFPA